MNTHPFSNWRAFAVAAAVTAAMAASADPAGAQRNQGPPNALQGFSKNRNEPVKIQAATLEVRDKDKMATFGGGVQVNQGDTEMRCRSMIVYYDDDGDGKGTVKAAQPGPGGRQQIRRIEAMGGVHVTQKDQVAVGDSGTFDMRANTVTLVGNVVVTRGQDIIRGHRLVVDLGTGVSKLDAGGGRVDMLIQPSGSNSMNPLAPRQGR